MGRGGAEEEIAPASEAPGSLAVLAALALVAGGLSGLIGALFGLALRYGDGRRNAFIAWAHLQPVTGFFLVVAAVAACAAIGAWLVRRFSPLAAGSGIPRVEAVLSGAEEPAPLELIPVKFVGGALAIAGGLALGREGPTVQMGASIGTLVGRLARRSWPDRRTLLAACSGAGLATAFNAPIGGAVFVLEELVRKFELSITIAALAASGGAIAVARLFLGQAPDFQVAPLPYPPLASGALFAALGLLAGLAGVIYNRTLLGALELSENLRRWPVELRAAAIGAGVGAVAWVTPALVGGGESVTQQVLSGGVLLASLPLMLLLRFVLATTSYAAGTPGGLFAPMLVIGAQLGFLFGGLCRWVEPGLALHPTAFAIVGMAAFFAAVVRAPLTGIVLVTEMTAGVTQLLPMLLACGAAMLVPTLMGDPPIYDSLREDPDR